MALPAGFKEDLDRATHGIESCQKELKGLYGQALVDKLPKPVQLLLQRKAGLLGHLLEDLEQIPTLVDEAERADNERHMRRVHGGQR